MNKSEKILVNGKNLTNNENINIIESENKIEVGSGTYIFEYTVTE